MYYNLGIFILSCVLISSASLIFARMGKAGLTMWVSLCGLLANLFVLKQIDLLGFNATASDTFAIGALFGLNLLQQRHGFNAAKEAIWISLAALAMFVIASQIHLAYAPSHYDNMHSVYESLLKPAPRLLCASLFTLFVVQQFDARLFRVLKSLNIASVTIISPMCIMLSQALDTILFTVLGLVGIIEKPIHIMLVSYTVKLIAIFSLFFISQLLINKLNAEQTHAKYSH